MKPGATKAYKRAALAFLIVAGCLLIFRFGSFYVGLYGFSLDPFTQPNQGQDQLWRVLFHAATSSAVAGLAAAVAIYFATKRDERQPADAESDMCP